jgi:superfamily II DNA or RNA helicase
MDTLINHKGYRIPFNQQHYDKIKKELTVKPFMLPDYDFNNKPFPVYRRNKEYIYLPKFYGIEKYGPPKKSEERVGNGEKLKNLEFKGKLKPVQESVIKQTLDILDKNDSTVLSLFTGFGKTVCALYIISVLKKKTLIVVHKEFLLNQWIERIQQFIPTARIGRIQQNTIDIEDKDIVITMLQSLTVRKNEYPKETFDSFEYVTFDEVHRVCSRTFSKALFKISTKKMLGLSATPERKDGLSKVLEWFLGGITVPELQKNLEYKAGVKFVEAQYENQPTINYNMRGKVNLPNLVTQISLDPIRNQQIIQEIVEANKNKRKILVLTERRQQCFDLQSLLPSNISGGPYVGGMKEEDLNDSNTKDVIFATYSMASEGYDNKTLDTLIMATGRSDIEQIVGRILRQENSNPPLIIDFNDNIEGLGSQAKKRERYYKKKGYINRLRGNKTLDLNKLDFIED